MYHIKPDKRAQTSADLICQALLHLIQEKPFSEITITDIQNVSTVSRSTFYRNFDCLEDVLALLCDRGFSEALASAKQTGKEMRIAVFHYWFGHSDVLETLVAIHRTDILSESFRRNETVKEVLKKSIHDDSQYDYFSEIVSGVIVGILVAWVRHGKQENENEVMHQVQGAFTQMIRFGMLGRFRIPDSLL